MNRTLSLTLLPLILWVFIEGFARLGANIENGHRILDLADTVRLLLCATFLLATYIGLRHGRWPKVLTYALVGELMGLELLARL